MNLATLIQGKKTKSVLNFATATVATLATVSAEIEEFVPSVAKIASVAVAAPEQDNIFVPVCFDSGSPANGGKDLPHFCEPGDCWCSEKLPGGDYPAGCIRIECEYTAPATRAEAQAPGTNIGEPHNFPNQSPHPLTLSHVLPNRRPCYSCRSMDYWMGGTDEYPLWICRNCHPPAPGAERIPPQYPEPRQKGDSHNEQRAGNTGN